AVVVIAAGSIALALSSPGSPRPTASKQIVTRTHTVSSSAIPAPKHAKHLCPLTGQPVRGGKVPGRPAIGIKIGNDPASRPQTGLLHADIVYEEMAEGGITRYLAVYQCQQAVAVGPVRSVRWDDWHVLATYGHPILAFSGGIDPWNTAVAHLGWLYDANGSFYPASSAYYRTSNRQPPWNFFSSTEALWRLDKNHTPPPPQFRYEPRPPKGSVAAYSATIVSYDSGQNVVWKWDASARQWERFVGPVPDTDSSGTQLHATNVVIEVVKTERGPYAESGTVPDTDSIIIGSGSAYVLRNGVVEKGTWRTPSYGDVPQLRMSNGKSMSLAPGNTFVELVPQSYPVQIAR
ncbi:MAG: DUF3048 domain-containing protein, partial [Acidimicrobiales bacterium]